MSFQTIPPIESPQKYLDTAFSRGREKVVKARQLTKAAGLKRAKFLELERLKAIHKSLDKSLSKILTSFPELDSLTPFYLDLVRCTIGYAKLKKSLGAVNWANKQIEKYYKHYSIKLKRCQDEASVKKTNNEFFGRTSSFINQIKKELKFLEEARSTMRTFPTIKSGLFTIAIFGFPNTGKTTLLSKLTSSTPKIAAYPFTTQSINIGYATHGSTKLQFLDTPGTLNRFNRMNNIEKQSHLVLKHVADAVIYVFDLQESYPLTDQIKLYNTIKNLDKPIYIYLSKSDILDKKMIKDFQKKYTSFTDSKNLLDQLLAGT